MKSEDERARVPRLVERALDRVFGADANPSRQLGALAFWLFWIVLVSGVYTYAFYDTGVEGAYASIEDLSRQPWHVGSIMRGLHRYASDGLMAIVGLHLVRELAYGHYRGFRWFSWVTGVPLMALALVSGLVGYWLVWDELAQFIAVAVTEWLGWLPGLGDALVRNFIAAEALSDRFFSLLIFAHIGVSLILLLGMWLHIQRISGARTFPRAKAGWVLLAALVALALVQPALSQAGANLARAPLAPALDWYFLFPLPLVYWFSPAGAWLVAASAVLFLGALPWLDRRSRAPAAVVDPELCNGCGRCLADCPYGAVMLVPATGPRARAPQAVVLGDLCAGCGICAGACPSPSPLREAALRSAIELPQRPIAALREEIDRALERGEAPAPVLVFGCSGGPDVQALARALSISLPCAGMLPPSLAEYALERGAGGVMIAACAEAQCEYRLGARWTGERLAGMREPRLHAWAEERIRLVSPQDVRSLERELDAFRALLSGRGMHG